MHIHHIVTHNGSFHADDVFAVATLQLLLGKEHISITRTRDMQTIKAADYVVDVGEIYDHNTNRFDHHQADSPIRENGIPYSAFGLVWSAFGATVSEDEAVAELIDEYLVQYVDAVDNGYELFTINNTHVYPFTLDDVIDTFIPYGGGGTSNDEGFTLAVDFAATMLKNLINDEKVTVRTRAEAEKIYVEHDNKEVVYLEHPISPSAFSHLPEVMFLIKPRTKDPDSDWIARAVPLEPRSQKDRIHFPESWAGLRDNELQVVSGVDDAVFCHKQRYIFIAKTKAGAEAAVKIALDKAIPKT